MLRFPALVAAILAALGVAGCSAGATPVPTTPPLEGRLATTDLGAGENRVSFLLLNDERLVTVPEVSVTARYVPDESRTEEATASFHPWPYGTRGNYAVRLHFDKPGRWALEVTAAGEDGVGGVAEIPMTVKRQSYTPAAGSVPPLVANRTIDDVANLAELTSWSTPDPDLYRITIPEALASPRPALVVFASPAFCTSFTCGPQVETVARLQERYGNEAHLIHVEVYDNPAEIQGDLDRARYSPVVKAWGITESPGYLNESWVFIMSAQGRVAARYQGYASAGELEEALRRVLG